MRWQDFRRSENVEDVGSSGRGGYGVGMPVRLSGGVIVVAVIASLLFGINPLDMLGALMGGGGPVVQAPAPQPGYGPSQAPPGAGAIDPNREFVERVLGSTEDVWTQIFQKMGGQYDPPKLSLFHGGVRSACGMASAASGPFYCPGDQRLYLDTQFFDELTRRFKAPGDFAQGYVIAHEVGHHVQNQLGIMKQFADQQRTMGEAQRNALSVRLELQADCFAGVWGHYVQSWNKLDPGDIDEGLRAAAAVGDDTIQKRTQGYVVPDAFTHGTAEQRTLLVPHGFRLRRRPLLQHLREQPLIAAGPVAVGNRPRCSQPIVPNSRCGERPGMTPSVACPGCGRPMRALVLERKPLGTVQVDLCGDCRALWFDAFESVQLTPGATLELFRCIHESAPQTREPLPARLPCPRCSVALVLTHDQTRTGRFAYYRCEKGHGRFTPFLQFLREKAFIRPLPPDELARLKAQVRVIRCASCGGPVDLEQNAVCPWCRSAIVALDPDSVARALAGYREAEAQRTSVDVGKLADALLMAGRTGPDPAAAPDPGGLDLVETGLRALTRALTGQR